MKRWTGPRKAMAALAAVSLLLMAGMASHGEASGGTSIAAAGISEMPLDCNPALLPHPDAERCRAARLLEGQRLFERETFGGNGRTCMTCHSRESGTLSPADVQALHEEEPTHPLFVHDGLDNGLAGTTRILEHATVRVTLPLPPYLTLQDDPGATEVTVHRSIPTTKFTPALDPALMWDLRAADLKVQALGAIRDHAQNAIPPTDLQLALIAEFQRTSARFLTDGRLKRFAETGEPPALPEGTTDAEKRGRLFFVDAPFAPPSKVGVCALCHSGPMLNRTNQFAPMIASVPGVAMENILVSEANVPNNPTRTFLIHDGLGPAIPVTTPDIGVLLSNPATTPLSAIPPPHLLPVFGLRLAFFANFFKIPTLWGVTETAPYFHDNSAKDLDQMLAQYDFLFLNHRAIRGQIFLTPEDKDDIKAFLNLL
jgi:hypothetical protein